MPPVVLARLILGCMNCVVAITSPLHHLKQDCPVCVDIPWWLVVFIGERYYDFIIVVTVGLTYDVSAGLNPSLNGKLASLTLSM